MRGLATLAREERTQNEFTVPWNRGNGNGWQAISEQTAFTLSAVWACQTLIADAIATLPVDTYRKKNEGVRESTSPPSWLASPNPENNRIDFDTQRILSLLSWGNCYTLLVRQGGSSDPMMPVLERWVLNPAHVRVLRTPNWEVETNPLQYFVRGEKVPMTNIQHIRGYVPPGWFLGMSVIAKMTQTLRVGLNAEEFGALFYDQGIVASGVLTIPALSTETSQWVMDKIREQLEERHAGPQNATRPMVLGGGTTWTQTMINPADAQFLETRKFQINEICRWFRVPPHKIADIIAHASQGGGMGIEQQSGEFAQDTLQNWVQRIELSDSDLLPRGQFLKYNLDAYVRTDLATQAAWFTAGRNGGWLCADDIRTLKDMQPLPAGKGQIYLQPSSMIEAGTQIPETLPQGEPLPADVQPPAPGAPNV